MILEPLETILIAHPDHPDGIRINASEYNPAVHTLWSEPEIKSVSSPGLVPPVIPDPSPSELVVEDKGKSKKS